jgi:outer membrane protein assembly factor BamA
MTYFKFLISCFVALAFINDCVAQQPAVVPGFYDEIKRINPDSTAKLRVASFNITGNKRTKSYIILREIQFKTGDSLIIGQLSSILEQARRQVFNSNLFSEVSITPVIISAYEISVHVTVREKWYLYPTPQFQLVDRNYNEWLKTYNGDLDRVVYGIKFAHYNFSGRGDQLRIYLLNGYSRNISFSYNTPYSNSRLSEGFRISAGYSQNREIPYKTSYNNKLLQFKKPGFVRNNSYASVSYQSRKGFFKRRIYTASFTYLHVNDSIIDPLYNPNYFNTANSSRALIDLSYIYQYVNIDHVNYPLSGKSYAFSVNKRGFGLKGETNMFYVDGVYNKYMSHFNNRLNSSIQLYAKLKLPFDQPYLNQRALGYGELYLRGMEYYVIDGVASAVAKYTVKKKLLSFKIPVPFNIRVLPNIPFTFYGKTYADVGYSYIKEQFDTRLNNRLLYSGGFGIDILTVYGININLEYSFNQLGENGIFLHGKGGF